MTDKQKLAKLEESVRNSLSLVEIDSLCNSGKEAYMDLCRQVGYNNTQFDTIDFDCISIHDVDNLKFDRSVVEEMMENPEVIDFNDGIEWLNGQKCDWRMAILNKNNEIIAEGEYGYFYIPE